MSCFKTLNFSGGCDLETCTEAAQIPISGTPTSTAQYLMAYAQDICYCLVAAWNAGFNTTYFFKYEPSTNTMVLKGSHAGAFNNSQMVYDVAHQKFVVGFGTDVVIFDPVSETITDFASGVTGFIAQLVYVAGTHNRVYGHMGQDGGGQRYIGYIDLDLNTVVQLGVAPVSGGSNPSCQNFVFSESQDCLYGCWQTGINKGMLEFSLTTNSGASFFTADPTWAQYECCFDTDRDLLICAAFDMIEVDVVTKTIVRRTNVNAATLESLRWTPFYVSSMKRVFLTGFNTVGDEVVGKYPTEAPYIGELVKDDYFYTGILKFDEGSFFSVANTKPAGVEGWRRLCLTA